MDCSFTRGGCSVVDFDNDSTETRMENVDIPITRSAFTVAEPDQTERQFFQFFQKPSDANNYNTVQATQAAPAQAVLVQPSTAPVSPLQAAPVPATVAPVQTSTAPVSAAGYFSNYYAANPYQYQQYQQNPYYFYQPYMYNYWPYAPQSSWGWGRKKRSAQQG